MGNEAKCKKALKELAVNVIAFENALDAEMRKPSTVERGQRIAKLLNALTVARQSAMRFTLGFSFNKIKRLETVQALAPKQRKERNKYGEV